MIGSQRVPVPSPTVAVAYLDGEAVLYDAELARPILLNSSAALVWAALDGRAVSEIAADLAVQFNVAAMQVEADVRAAIARFDELGLLATPGAAHPA